MRKILVCQHVAHEILGTLDPLFKESGFRIRYANFSRFPDLKPSLDGYNGLIVLGGPMNVDETDKHPHLVQEVRLIEEALKKEIPILGICLGAQLIAKTLGAPVTKNPEKEIGWYDVFFNAEAKKDPLFSNFSATEKMFQWHGDTFAIPESAVHLASSATCTNQAFRYKNNVYALQFHLEVDTPMIERWFKIPLNQAELKNLKKKIDERQVAHDTSQYIGRLGELSFHAFGAFSHLFGQHKKRGILPSR